MQAPPLEKDSPLTVSELHNKDDGVPTVAETDDLVEHGDIAVPAEAKVEKEEFKQPQQTMVQVEAD